MEALEYSKKFLSGRKDLRGVDVLRDWRLLLTKEEILLAVQKCADWVNITLEGQELAVVCIMKGAIYFFTDFTERLIIPYSVHDVRVSSYQNAQVQADAIEVMGVINPEQFKGKRVLLIDELFDNGFTLHSVKSHFMGLGIDEETILTCTLFKKEKEGEFPPPDFYGLKVPNVWLVGYGLDDSQEKRGWKVIYACPKAEGIPKTPADRIFDSDEIYLKERLKLTGQLSVLN